MTYSAGGEEIPLSIACADTSMIGVLHHGADDARRGIVIVVGGPQVRVGSHRQFVLLARRWAKAGIPVLRFDCRGKGDSSGEFVDFEHLDGDIAAAVDALTSRCPELEEIVLWGLCDAASAILMYAHGDPRVTGIAILNPWVRTEDGIARAYLKHYYARKLLDPAFWRKLVSGGIDVGRSLKALFAMLRALGRRTDAQAGQGEAHSAPTVTAPFPDRMASGLERFAGRVLLILCGNDLTAKEFIDHVARSSDWRRLIGADNVVRHDLTEADHTFSRAAWREQVSDWTLEWLARPAPAPPWTVSVSMASTNK